MIDREKIYRAKVRVHFKAFVKEVKQATGLACKIPDSLLDTLPAQLDQYVSDELKGMGLEYFNGLWQAR